MRRWVRKGSKIIWLVSILTGDCRFPTEQRFQAELTKPQKVGTVMKKRKEGIISQQQLSGREGKKITHS